MVKETLIIMFSSLNLILSATINLMSINHSQPTIQQNILHPLTTITLSSSLFRFLLLLFCIYILSRYRIFNSSILLLCCIQIKKFYFISTWFFFFFFSCFFFVFAFQWNTAEYLSFLSLFCVFWRQLECVGFIWIRFHYITLYDCMSLCHSINVYHSYH